MHSNIIISYSHSLKYKSETCILISTFMQTKPSRQCSIVERKHIKLIEITKQKRRTAGSSAVTNLNTQSNINIPRDTTCYIKLKHAF